MLQVGYFGSLSWTRVEQRLTLLPYGVIECMQSHCHWYVLQQIADIVFCQCLLQSIWCLPYCLALSLWNQVYIALCLIRKGIGKFFDHISERKVFGTLGICLWWRLVSFLFVECLSSYSFNNRAVSGHATILRLSAASFSVMHTMPPSPLTIALSCSWTWSWANAENLWLVFCVTKPPLRNCSCVVGQVFSRESTSLTWTVTQRA